MGMIKKTTSQRKWRITRPDGSVVDMDGSKLALFAVASRDGGWHKIEKTFRMVIGESVHFFLFTYCSPDHPGSTPMSR